MNSRLFRYIINKNNDKEKLFVLKNKQHRIILLKGLSTQFQITVQGMLYLQRYPYHNKSSFLFYKMILYLFSFNNLFYLNFTIFFNIHMISEGNILISIFLHFLLVRTSFNHIQLTLKLKEEKFFGCPCSSPLCKKELFFTVLGFVFLTLYLIELAVDLAFFLRTLYRIVYS